MNGLEAIELMKQGKKVSIVDAAGFYQIKDGRIWLTYPTSKVTGEVLFFDLSNTYCEYIEPKPLTGWERVDGKMYNVILVNDLGKSMECGQFKDYMYYKQANYFSTKEKAEEIIFKQRLFRKLQRFSDENGGNEIDWENTNQKKYCILYCHSFKELQSDFTWVRQNQGQIYFISKEIAEKAIMLFHDELIKYFTGDFGGEA